VRDAQTIQKFKIIDVFGMKNVLLPCLNFVRVGKLCESVCNGCFFKFGVEVGVELSIVNALYRLRITDQLFKSYAFTRVVRSQTTLQRLLRRQIKKKHSLQSDFESCAENNPTCLMQMLMVYVF
jgi:hypothetical protein